VHKAFARAGIFFMPRQVELFLCLMAMILGCLLMIYGFISAASALIAAVLG
jgi:hypothetical protein